MNYNTTSKQKTIKTTLIAFCFMLLSISQLKAQSQFITEWVLSTGGSGANSIRFYTTNANGPISYSWQQMPSGSSGSGTFSAGTGQLRTISSLPSSATIRLSIDSANLQRFYINASSDMLKLKKIIQWGTANWTSMESAFNGCENLESVSMSTPNLKGVKNMSLMFRKCIALIGDVSMNNWRTDSITNMQEMFLGAKKFNQNIGNWNTSNVTNMSYMFEEATDFNMNIGNWNTAKVTDMRSMFFKASFFNQNIGNWNTANVTLMGSMFEHATKFNQPIGNWNTSNVTNMSYMFYETNDFNQNIGNWNTANVTSMSGMFYNAKKFNQPIGNWNTDKLTSCTQLFNGALVFNQDISNWNMSMCSDMNSMFFGASSFNQNLGKWQLKSNVSLSNMLNSSGMDCHNYTATLKGWSASAPNSRSLDANGLTFSYYGAAFRNILTKPIAQGGKGWTIAGDNLSATGCGALITQWDLSKTGSGSNNQISFNATFGVGGGTYYWKEIFPGNASGYDTLAAGSGLKTISGLPSYATIVLEIYPNNLQTFAINNGIDKSRLVDIKNWGAANWSSMENAFYGCNNLNISATDNPNFVNVSNFSNMFNTCGALKTLASINNWNTANGTNMSAMFKNSSLFNLNISNWNTANVSNMAEMFADANVFNQNIGNWNTANISNMNSMFKNANAFNQNIGNWVLNSNVDMSNMLDNSGMDCSNYSATLYGWNNTAPNSRTLGAAGITYGSQASNARANLVLATGSGGKGWTISDAGLSTGNCGAFITRWDLSKTGVAGNNSISFYTDFTTGGGTYTWETEPAASSGSGTLASGNNLISITGLPANAIIRLKIMPLNLQKFYLNSLGNAQRLIDVEAWGTAQWTSMETAFRSCVNLNISATDVPNLSNVQSMNGMFLFCSSLNSPANINQWNTTNVTIMANMFSKATSFNQPIGNWNTANVTNMNAVFQNASAFNQAIGNWNTSKVTDMSAMFDGATAFNQNINNWNTAAVTTMRKMFTDASAFNQNISQWQTTNVTDMVSMFQNASVFNQNISNWQFNSSAQFGSMLSNSGMSCANYSALLNKFNTTSLTSKTFSATGVSYGTNASAARTNLINNKGWSITDGGSTSSVCGSFITIWDLRQTGTGSNNDEISYNATVAGGTAAYTWETIPAGSSGFGNMSIGTSLRTISGLPANATIKLTIVPTNLRQFIINYSGNSARLIDIAQWGITKWTSMENAFAGCGSLGISATDMPDLSGVSNMAQMFQECGNLNGPANINQWNTSTITNMSYLFDGDALFNQNLNNWNTANVTNMSGMFRNARIFNQNIGNWNTANVTNMSNMFESALFYDNDSASINWNTANVTEMRAMFLESQYFNRDISNWNTNKVTDMSFMFSDATAFNQNISNWNTANVTNMSSMFYYAFDFNQAIGNWNTAKVTNMSLMFNYATSFNQPINNWNTGNVTTMQDMFRSASKFNQPLNNWNTAKVLDMNFLFYFASAFNQNIGNWALNASVTMQNMLDYCGMDCSNYSLTLIGWQTNGRLNRTLGADNLKYGAQGVAARNNLVLATGSGGRGWTITGDNFTSTSCGYYTTKWDLSQTGAAGNNTISFSATIASGDAKYTWETVPFNQSGSGTFAAGTSLRTISGIPENAIIKLKIAPTNLQRFNISNGTDKSRLIDVEQWETTDWTSMQGAFDGCNNLNISATDTPFLHGVTSLASMFRGCSKLNTPTNINTWNTRTVTAMNAMFQNASSFNQNIGNWNTGNVISMASMFSGATVFNQDITNWNTIKVTNMLALFARTDVFNQNISTWKTDAVTNMDAMFFNAKSFNQPIGNWSTGIVRFMGTMFSNALAFNQDISTWNTASVMDMYGMFEDAKAFNQNISTWNTAAVADMNNLFKNASNFNQNLGAWQLKSNVVLTDMFYNSGLNCSNYSNTLIAWNNTAPNGRNLGNVNRKYNLTATAARTNLLLPVASGGKGWTFSGDAPINQNAYLVPDNSTITGNYACDEVVDLTDNDKIILKIFPNGNSFDFVSTSSSVKAEFVNNIPAGVNAENSGGGYYQIDNGTNIARISRRMISIENPNNYTTNGGVIVRIYYNAADTENIVTDAVPAGVDAITQSGWYKSSIHNAQDVVNNLSANGNALSSATQIFPTARGEENGILYVEFLVQNFSTFGFFALSNLIPLPVQIHNFTAKKLSNNSAILKWNANIEESNIHFEVERSLNGKNFVKIATVKAQGNANKAQNYQYTDNTIVNGTPKAFYRIKQVDVNGKSTSTHVQIVNFNQTTNGIAIYPNPANSILNISLPTETEKATVTITDAMGKVVFTAIVGANADNINISSLSTGIYNVNIVTETEIKNIKLLKQ